MFVYDKRGTGASGGEYSHDYGLLAKDAVAALREAQRLAGSRAGRIGYYGTSQGGWVAPLAATMAPVDFVIVGYGLAVSPIEEDRAAIELDMTRRGYGPDVVTKALEVGDATEAILVSNFKSGFDRLDAVRAKYGNEPWFKYVHGNFTFFMLELPESEVRERGPKMFPGVSLHYDPMPVLRGLSTPQLWILGGDDLDAPSAETVRRLHTLAASGKPIDIAIFPRAEHGIFEYETAADGTRLSTRNSEGYFAMMRDYILEGRLWRVYGSSILHGNVTFFMLELPESEVRERGPKMFPGVSLHYDPMPVLRRLSTPQLWILGGDDLDAPIAETVRRLHALAANGKPIDIAIFPRAEHGIFEYETAADGTRLSTRNSEGYFAMMRDYILEGRLWRVYGSSILHVAGR